MIQTNSAVILTLDLETWLKIYQKALSAQIGPRREKTCSGQLISDGQRSL